MEISGGKESLTETIVPGCTSVFPSVMSFTPYQKVRPADAKTEKLIKPAPKNELRVSKGARVRLNTVLHVRGTLAKKSYSF